MCLFFILMLLQRKRCAIYLLWHMLCNSPVIRIIQQFLDNKSFVSFLEEIRDLKKKISRAIKSCGKLWRYEDCCCCCKQHSEPKIFNLLQPTGYAIHQQVQYSRIVRSAHTVFVCFVLIWEKNSDLCHLIINWLVFITEMKSVYCAVRTGSLNKAVCAPSLKG
jgi:hypothetical protein